MSAYDPMLDYTVRKIQDGIKGLQHLDKFSDYDYYAPVIASSMLRDIQDYLDNFAHVHSKDVSR